MPQRPALHDRRAAGAAAARRRATRAPASSRTLGPARPAGFAVGDRVALLWRPRCGECDACVRGNPILSARFGRVFAHDERADGRRPPRLHRDGRTLHHLMGVSCFAERVVVSETSAATGARRGAAGGRGDRGLRRHHRRRRGDERRRRAPRDAPLGVDRRRRRRARRGDGCRAHRRQPGHCRRHRPRPSSRSPGSCRCGDARDRRAPTPTWPRRIARAHRRRGALDDRRGRPARDHAAGGRRRCAPAGTLVAVGLSRPDDDLRGADQRAGAAPEARRRRRSTGPAARRIDLPRIFALYLAGRLPLDALVGARRPLGRGERGVHGLAVRSGRARRSSCPERTTDHPSRGAHRSPALRSSEWYGPTDRNGYLHRAWMRRGVPSSALSGQRPQIAIANTASDLTPCNMHLDEVAESVKHGVYETGGVPLNLPVVSLGETLVRPTAMLWRNMAAMAMEEMFRANPIDGLVLLGGCDKTIPALLMAAASRRASRPSSSPAARCSTGPSAAGPWAAAPTSGGSARRCRAGTLSEESFLRSESLDDPEQGPLQHDGDGLDDGRHGRGPRHDAPGRSPGRRQRTRACSRVPTSRVAWPSRWCRRAASSVTSSRAGSFHQRDRRARRRRRLDQRGRPPARDRRAARHRARPSTTSTGSGPPCPCSSTSSRPGSSSWRTSSGPAACSRCSPR